MSRLEEIQARVEAASQGPWAAIHRHGFCLPNDDEQAGLGLEIEGPPEAWNRGQFARGADATFIAHARSDVPWLLSRVRALEAGLAKYGRHGDECMMGDNRDYPCSCGFAALDGEE